MSASIEDFTYDPTAQIEVSDILGKTIMNFSAIYSMYILINCFYIFSGLVGKNWSIFCVSPLWNLKFSTDYLNLLSKELNNHLINHSSTILKNQIKSIPQISVEIEAKEGHHECLALMVIKKINYRIQNKYYFCSKGFCFTLNFIYLLYVYIY